MNYEVNKWNDLKFGKLTFQNICRKYSSDKNLILDKEPPFLRSVSIINDDQKYMVRWNQYEPNANFGGQATEAVYFILNGKCEIKFDKNIIKLEKGDCFEFPKDKYNFKVIGDEILEYVAVYKIPDDLLEML